MDLPTSLSDLSKVVSSKLGLAAFTGLAQQFLGFLLVQGIVL